MHLYNYSSPNTTDCHQVALVPGEEADGGTSIPREAACSLAAPNTAEAPARFCAKPKMSVPWGVFGCKRQPGCVALQLLLLVSRHSLCGAQLQPGLGPAVLVLSHYFVKLPECP